MYCSLSDEVQFDGSMAMHEVNGQQLQIAF